jgi:hypothetical protein
MIHIIRTKYLGRTEFKGPRIRATHTLSGKTLVENYDHSAHEPYALVADKLVTKLMQSEDIGRPVTCVGSTSDGKLQLFVYQAVK